MKSKITKTLMALLLLVSIAVLFQECFIFRRKNKCDSCPGLVKNKKIRKPTKGSI